MFLVPNIPHRFGDIVYSPSKAAYCFSAYAGSNVLWPCWTRVSRCRDRGCHLPHTRRRILQRPQGYGLQTFAGIDINTRQEPFLLKDIWTVHEDVLSEHPNVTHSAYWRFMLINDGHVVRVMRILTLAESKLILLENQLLGNDVFVAFLGRSLLGTWRRRQVTIVDGQGTPLVYIVSWWEEKTYQQLDKQVRRCAGWDFYDLVHWEIARKICALHFGICNGLDQLFGVQGPYWGKSYTFKVGKRVRVFNHEILSPSLSRYIGTMTRPTIPYPGPDQAFP